MPTARLLREPTGRVPAAFDHARPVHGRLTREPTGRVSAALEFLDAGG